MNIDEQEILRMALVGYAMELVKIQDQIESVRIMLTIANSPVADQVESVELELDARLSVEGRARIIAANKKRWANAKREKSRKGGRG
jgi:hypothetical protein